MQRMVRRGSHSRGGRLESCESPRLPADRPTDDDEAECLFLCDKKGNPKGLGGDGEKNGEF